MIDQRQFFEKRDAAADIHTNRIAGLYVENSDGGLNVPSDAILSQQARALIGLAESLVKFAESEKPRDDIPQEEIDLQIWFLNAVDEAEMRKRIFSTQSFEKLKQLNNVIEWTRSIKAECEASDNEMKQLAEHELRRAPKADGKIRKDRWKIRFRVETTSNIIRPAVLKEWNKSVEWIKLVPVQGAKKKNQLIVELTLGDDVPVAALWGLGLSLCLQFLVAMNMATGGFWWWPPAPNQRIFYETIRDLETGHNLEIEAGGFQVFNHRSVLTPVHIQSVMLCLASLPPPNDHRRGRAYTYYLGGLSFIAINSIQWRCEGQAFGNFLESFKLLMTEALYRLPSEEVEKAIGRFLSEKFPDLAPEHHTTFTQLVRDFEQRTNPVVKIDDVYLMKLLCETIFRETIVPEIQRQRRALDGPPESPADDKPS